MILLLFSGWGIWLCFTFADGGRFVKKAAEKSSDSVPDLDDLGHEEDSEVLKSGQEELVFGL